MQHRADTGFPPGTIVTAAAAQPRFFEFSTSLEHLEVPAGTVHHLCRGCDIAHNFNRGVHGMKGEWAWFLGDDHAFPPDILLKFLAYDVDVVVPITPSKVAPWYPCVMHGPYSTQMQLYRWDELSAPGLMALPAGDFIGQAGMLVKRHVLDAIGEPWFKTGQFSPGRLNEDLWFCHELQAKGFTVWVDCSTVFEHIFHVGVHAKRVGGKWVPALRSGLVTVVLPEEQPITLDHNPGQRAPTRWIPADAVPVTA